MAVNAPVYAGSPLTSDTSRGPSPEVWYPAGSPPGWIANILENPQMGIQFFDDFAVSGFDPGAGAAAALLGNLGQWSVYVGSTAQLRDGGIYGGGLQFVPGSIAVSSGASTPTTAISSMVGAFQIASNSSGNSALQGRLAFECRLMLTSVTDVKRAAFAGLAEGAPAAGNPFLVVSAGSSNELSSTRNLIGFYFPSSGLGGDCRFVFQKASTAAVFPTNLASLVSTVTGSSIVAGTFYKLGFVFDQLAPSAAISSASTGQTAGAIAKQMLRIYVNGIQAAAFLTQTENILTASFPVGNMGPMVAFANVSNSGTSNSATNLSGLMTCDWVRTVQANLI
jgi:hypothetical protein